MKVNCIAFIPWTLKAWRRQYYTSVNARCARQIFYLWCQKMLLVLQSKLECKIYAPYWMCRRVSVSVSSVRHSESLSNYQLKLENIDALEDKDKGPFCWDYKGSTVHNIFQNLRRNRFTYATSMVTNWTKDYITPADTEVWLRQCLYYSTVSSFYGRWTTPLRSRW